MSDGDFIRFDERTTAFSALGYGPSVPAAHERPAPPQPSVASHDAFPTPSAIQTLNALPSAVPGKAASGSTALGAGLSALATNPFAIPARSHPAPYAAATAAPTAQSANAVSGVAPAPFKTGPTPSFAPLTPLAPFVPFAPTPAPSAQAPSLQSPPQSPPEPQRPQSASSSQQLQLTVEPQSLAFSRPPPAALMQPQPQAHPMQPPPALQRAGPVPPQPSKQALPQGPSSIHATQASALQQQQQRSGGRERPWQALSPLVATASPAGAGTTAFQGALGSQGSGNRQSHDCGHGHYHGDDHIAHHVGTGHGDSGQGEGFLGSDHRHGAGSSLLSSSSSASAARPRPRLRSTLLGRLQSKLPDAAAVGSRILGWALVLAAYVILVVFVFGYFSALLPSMGVTPLHGTLTLVSTGGYGGGAGAGAGTGVIAAASLLEPLSSIPMSAATADSASTGAAPVTGATMGVATVGDVHVTVSMSLGARLAAAVVTAWEGSGSGSNADAGPARLDFTVTLMEAAYRDAPPGAGGRPGADTGSATDTGDADVKGSQHTDTPHLHLSLSASWLYWAAVGLHLWLSVVSNHAACAFAPARPPAEVALAETGAAFGRLLASPEQPPPQPEPKSQPHAHTQAQVQTLALRHLPLAEATMPADGFPAPDSSHLAAGWAQRARVMNPGHQQRLLLQQRQLAALPLPICFKCPQPVKAIKTRLSTDPAAAASAAAALIASLSPPAPAATGEVFVAGAAWPPVFLSAVRRAFAAASGVAPATVSVATLEATAAQRGLLAPLVVVPQAQSGTAAAATAAAAGATAAHSVPAAPALVATTVSVVVPSGPAAIAARLIAGPSAGARTGSASPAVCSTVLMPAAPSAPAPAAALALLQSFAAKPPRAHHCSVCGRCAARMDHHCPWLGTCVHAGNHRYFYALLLWVAVGGLFILAATVGVMWAPRPEALRAGVAVAAFATTPVHIVTTVAAPSAANAVTSTRTAGEEAVPARVRALRFFAWGAFVAPAAVVVTLPAVLTPVPEPPSGSTGAEGAAAGYVDAEAGSTVEAAGAAVVAHKSSPAPAAAATVEEEAAKDEPVAFWVFTPSSALTFMSCLAGSFSFAVVALLGLHTYLISTARTTLELFDSVGDAFTGPRTSPSDAIHAAATAVPAATATREDGDEASDLEGGGGGGGGASRGGASGGETDDDIEAETDAESTAMQAMLASDRRLASEATGGGADAGACGIDLTRSQSHYRRRDASTGSTRRGSTAPDRRARLPTAAVEDGCTRLGSHLWGRLRRLPPLSLLPQLKASAFDRGSIGANWEAVFGPRARLPQQFTYPLALARAPAPVPAAGGARRWRVATGSAGATAAVTAILGTAVAATVPAALSFLAAAATAARWGLLGGPAVLWAGYTTAGDDDSVGALPKGLPPTAPGAPVTAAAPAAASRAPVTESWLWLLQAHLARGSLPTEAPGAGSGPNASELRTRRGRRDEDEL